MPLTKEGYWIPKLSEKGIQVFNNYSRYLLVAGPRKSGKTIAVLKKLIRHAWELPGAKIGIFTKYVKNAKQGVWDYLCENSNSLIDEWIESVEGFEYAVRPKVDGATRMHYFRIKNMHGSVSEIQLHAIDKESEIESKLKSTQFTCIFVNELDNFMTRKIFNIAILQLRSVHIDSKNLQFIADTNPAEDGDQNWIYKLWFQDRVRELSEMEADKRESFEKFRKNLDLIEIMIPENPFLSEDERVELEGMYIDDPELYDRYILGKWTASASNAHFGKVYRPAIHKIGNVKSPDPDDWEILSPTDKCSELITGWDLGDNNHSAHILERVEGPHGVWWQILDEMVVVGDQMSIEDFTLEFMQKMIDIMDSIPGREIKWIHWADESAFSRFRAAGNVYDYMVVSTASGGMINLQPAPKFAGSVGQRINVVRNLLKRNRLFISAQCEMTERMFRFLKKGGKGKLINPGDVNKHAFDSLSYPIISESFEELQLADRPEASKRSELVSVG
jgi:PBSX family phage terminase large subunit